MFGNDNNFGGRSNNQFGQPFMNSGGQPALQSIGTQGGSNINPYQQAQREQFNPVMPNNRYMPQQNNRVRPLSARERYMQSRRIDPRELRRRRLMALQRKNRFAELPAMTTSPVSGRFGYNA
jgi:hypothetical protein